MNDSLEFLFGKQTEIQLLIESFKLTPKWHSILVKLTMKLFKHSSRIQLLTRIYQLAQLERGKLHVTAARHIHQLIMVRNCLISRFLVNKKLLNFEVIL